MSARPEVTDLLARVASGDASARESLFERVYDELKRVARGQMRRSGEWLPIDPTTLARAVATLAKLSDARVKPPQHADNAV